MYTYLPVQCGCDLLQVFQMAYCHWYDPTKKEDYEEVCETFVTTICNTYPSFKNKQKVHLLVHLVECMDEFGPTAVFNAERYIMQSK